MDTIWELRGRVIPALTLWASTTARARSTTLFSTQGMSPLFQETEAYRCRDGSGAGWVAEFISGAALASPLRARPWCVEPLVRPPQAPATSAAPSRSAASSEPRASLAGRDIRPRETQYKAIPKAGTEARHATERAAPTIFCSRRTVRAPNICRPNRAVRRRRRSPSSQ
jgi:hypothetical protein